MSVPWSYRNAIHVQIVYIPQAIQPHPHQTLTIAHHRHKGCGQICAW